MINCLKNVLYIYIYIYIYIYAGSTNINQLQKLQNRAARIIANSSFDTPSRPLIVELGWKTIEELIGNETRTMIFKSLNDLAPPAASGTLRLI